MDVSANLLPQAERVLLNGKWFRPYKSEAELRQAVEVMALALNAYARKYPLQPIVLAPVLTGALRFSADLMQRLKFPYELSPVKVGSYGQGMQSSGQPQILLDFQGGLAGKIVVILEDIVESGRTLEVLRATLKAQGVAELRVATLLFKEEAFLRQRPDGCPPPDFYGLSIPDDFVVGYGLDYAEQGRWLNGLYVLDSL